VIEHFEPLQTSRLHLEPITGEVARSIASGDTAGLGAADGWTQEGTLHGVTLALEQAHPAGWLVRSAGRVIGDCGIGAPVDDAGCVEMGYGLAGPYRGQGLGTEVVMAISDWLLRQPSVSTVRARTLPSNAASRRVLEKLASREAFSAEARRTLRFQRVSAVVSAHGRVGPDPTEDRRQPTRSLGRHRAGTRRCIPLGCHRRRLSGSLRQLFARLETSHIGSSVPETSLGRVRNGRSNQ
jgi:RimJ/RimL family protein N-acetyltransferase